MNTVVISLEPAASLGPKRRTKTRLRAGNPSTVAGLWLVLAVMASGMAFSSPAGAQDGAWQDDQQPRRRARAATPSYPDDEVPSGRVAMSDEPTPIPAPPRGTVESPSNPSSARKRSQPAGDAASAEEVQPGHGTSPSRRPAADEGNRMDSGEPFGACADDCDGNDFGYCGPALHDVLCNRLFFRGEALLWWMKGGETPPLLTTSPANTPQSQAGVLGQPNTTVIFGDEELNTGLHAGSRMTFGLELDDCHQSGVEFSYFILGANVQTFNNASMGNPILARPFFNVTTGAQDSNLVAFPNALNGTFNVSSTENFQGAEALWRTAIVHSCQGGVDILVGYRFNRLTDGLEIADSVTSSGSASVAPAGTTINVFDTFHTRNDFNGADLGFSTQWRRNRWSLDTSLKLGIGETHSVVLINGWTTVIANGTTAGFSGGQLALPSNMGIHDSYQFSVMPEIGLTLGYDLTSRLRATAGYTLLYWSGVARPGDQIDLNLDPRQFPPPTTTTATKPEFTLHTSDFWAQGLNLGLDFRF